MLNYFCCNPEQNFHIKNFRTQKNYNVHMRFADSLLLATISRCINHRLSWDWRLFCKSSFFLRQWRVNRDAKLKNLSSSSDDKLFRDVKFVKYCADFPRDWPCALEENRNGNSMEALAFLPKETFRNGHFRSRLSASRLDASLFWRKSSYPCKCAISEYN